jgi:hypothetical protein
MMTTTAAVKFVDAALAGAIIQPKFDQIEVAYELLSMVP